MSFDYNDFLIEIQGMLVKSATSTGLWASLSVNYPTLTSDNILIGEPSEIVREIDRYPLIVINLKDKEEELNRLGSSANSISRDIKLNVDIAGFIHVGSTNQDAGKQARTLARNIETAFRSNFGWATTTGWDTCFIKKASFSTGYTEDKQVYNKNVLLNAEFMKYSIT